MKFLELKVPPLLLLCISSGGAYLIGLFSGQALFSNPSMLSLSIVLLAVGVYVAVQGVLEFRRHNTTVDPLHPEAVSKIVDTGVYSKTRNPMYVGFVLMLAAWCLAVGVMQCLWVLPLFVLYLTKFQIEPEERVLAVEFDGQYELYCQKVRRWV